MSDSGGTVPTASRRRRFILLGAGMGFAAIGAAWLLRPGTAVADRIEWDKPLVEAPFPLTITVYRGEGCGCCTLWVEHLERHGFTIDDHLMSNADLRTKRMELGVPDHLAGCHTGVTEGFVIEGHVPADDIKRLVIERPDVSGLSVPGMPVGSPGMEIGDRRDPFKVIAFGETGEWTFGAYGVY